MLSPCSIQGFSPPSQKAAKVKSFLFHWFWTHSGPTSALGRRIGTRIVEPMEGRLLWLQGNAVAVQREGWKNRNVFVSVGQIISFSNESHHFEKARISTRDLNDTFLQRESKLDPPKKGPEGKGVILELCWPTEIDVAKKMATP